MYPQVRNSTTLLTLHHRAAASIIHKAHEMSKKVKKKSNLLNFVHFKNTVARISILSKLWYFQYESKKSTTILKKLRFTLYKMNGLQYTFLANILIRSNRVAFAFILSIWLIYVGGPTVQGRYIITTFCHLV